MTNEEKAIQVATDSQGHIQSFAHMSALEMALWKDEQIDTILLTVEGCLRSFFESRGNTPESITNFIDAIKAQINKNLSEL